MKGRWVAILSGWLVGESLTDWLVGCSLVGRRVALVGTLRCSADWPVCDSKSIIIDIIIQNSVMHH